MNNDIYIYIYIYSVIPKIMELKSIKLLLKKLKILI